MGEGLANEFRLFRLSTNTVSQFRARGKLPEVHSKTGIKSVHQRLTGRCPITTKLMSQMIGMFLQNRESTVKLLQQNHTGQFVRERHPS